MLSLPALRRSTWNLLLLAVFFGGVLFIGVTRVQPVASVTSAPAPIDVAPAPEIGHPAPPFTLHTPEGATVALADLRGQVVLINFWATWCPPCRAEMPAIQAAFAQYQPQGFTVLAVTAGEDAATVTAFLQAHDLHVPALLDTNGQVHATYFASTLPSSFFIDRRGIVRAIYKGPMSHSVITGTVGQLLAEQ
jgi:cytochrome c biogenesis protein CcmG/thiol:disulfide interchange protein DsbE